MIDLHLHLDGSLEPEFLFELARKQNIDISYDEVEKRVVCKNSNSLNDYLTCFDFPLQLMQTEEALYDCALHLMERLEKEGILYSEIRFAPQLHTRKGLCIGGVIKAVLRGINEGNRRLNIKAQIILCCMRGNDNKLQNIETVREGSKYLGKGVVAVDLAGAEAIFKTKEFKYIFDVCKEVGMPFVIHAGENDDYTSVKSAIDFGASRIGHGIALKDNEDLIQEVIKRGIAIEMCPTSNLQTKAIKNIEDFPVREYLNRGILATINTDNMTVSNTTLDKEFNILEKNLNLTKEEKKQLICNSVQASFLNEEKKAKLMIKVLDVLK